MIATDATCSGMQILAGLSQDKRTAELVNELQVINLLMLTAVHKQMINSVPDHRISTLIEVCKEVS